MPRLALVALGILLLTGCAPTIVAEPTPEPLIAEPTTEERTEVNWENQFPAMQQIIDEETAEGDCTALQEMFDIHDNSNVTDPDVLAYIDEALALADCY